MKNVSKVILIFTILSFVLLSGCGSKAPNENLVLQTLTSANAGVISEESTPGYTGEPIYFDIDSVDIDRQQTEERINVTYCYASLKSLDYTATIDYCLYYNLYDDGNWYLDNYYVEGYELIPLKGADESFAEETIAKSLKAVNEEIQTGFLGDTYTYDSSYSLTLLSHETDFESLTDQLEYQYNKESELCKESGTVKIIYRFDSTNGCWNSFEIDDSDVEVIEYYPQGQWLFDISTYYVRLYIDDVDYSSNTATIYSKASVWQSEANSGNFTQSQTVSFTINDKGMEFSSFDVGNFTIQIMLTNDNMYYKTDSTNYRQVNWYRNRS